MPLNRLDDQAGPALAVALRKLSKLTYLSLRDNTDFGSGGCAALSQGLKKSHLEELSFEGCSVTDEGAADLIKVLGKHKHLHTLNLRGCPVGDSFATALASILKKPNRTLKVVILGSTAISPEGARRLSEALQVNSCIRSLVLPHSLEEGTAALFQNTSCHVSFES